MKAIIVDDESKARNSLRILLENFTPEVEVLKEAESVDAAYEAILRLNPDLVFLDIEMPPYRGFDLLNKFRERDFEVIFTTAYSEFAIKAIKAEAIDYVLKPVIVEELVNAIDRVKRKMEASTGVIQSTDDKIALADSNGVSFVDVGDIVRCESDKNYTTFYFYDRRKQVIARTLKEFDEILSPKGFVRVHHSHLVNLQHVVRFEKRGGGSVILSDDSEVFISRRKKDTLVQSLKANNFLGF